MMGFEPFPRAVFSAALATALAVLVSLPLASEQPSGNSRARERNAAAAMASYPQSLSGDYTVYRDYSWKAPTWVGFLRYDESTWGAFVITPSSGTNVSVLFRTETADGAMILTGQQIISKITQDDVSAVNYLMKLLPDLALWRSEAGKRGAIVEPTQSGAASPGADSPGKDFPAARSGLLPPMVSLCSSSEEFGGDIVLTFAPEIPVFGLASMAGSDGKVILSLERAGRVQSGGDAAFFGFVPQGEAKSGASLSVPASRKTESRTVDGITLKLDGQWTMVADNTFFLGDSAVIIVDTLDIALMQIPRDNLVLSLVRLFSLSSGSSWAVPSALSVTGDERKFRVENSFYDAVSGTMNRDIKLCVPSSDGKKCAVASLSVNETAYRANREYFDSLFR